MTGERSPEAAHVVVRRLGEALPDVRVVRIAGAGHMGPLSHADEVNSVIESAFFAACR
jgi:pimeloyl-ACP methyl ester carboxylesterase